MSGTAVLYVSRSGHSRALAESVASKLGAKAVEIGDLVSRSGFFGYMRAGSQAARGAATPIRDPGVELASVRNIVLVQPVWAGAVCPPLRSWLHAHKAELSGKKLGLLVSNKGSEGGPVKAKFEAEFGSLAAFACLHETQPESEKEAEVERLCKVLGT